MSSLLRQRLGRSRAPPPPDRSLTQPAGIYLASHSSCPFGGRAHANHECTPSGAPSAREGGAGWLSRHATRIGSRSGWRTYPGGPPSRHHQGPSARDAQSGAVQRQDDLATLLPLLLLLPQLLHNRMIFRHWPRLNSSRHLQAVHPHLALVLPRTCPWLLRFRRLNPLSVLLRSLHNGPIERSLAAAQLLTTTAQQPHLCRSR